jgi:hypothetical protein
LKSIGIPENTEGIVCFSRIGINGKWFSAVVSNKLLRSDHISLVVYMSDESSFGVNDSVMNMAYSQILAPTIRHSVDLERKGMLLSLQPAEQVSPDSGALNFRA